MPLSCSQPLSSSHLQTQDVGCIYKLLTKVRSIRLRYAMEKVILLDVFEEMSMEKVIGKPSQPFPTKEKF